MLSPAHPAPVTNSTDTTSRSSSKPLTNGAVIVTQTLRMRLLLRSEQPNEPSPEPLDDGGWSHPTLLRQEYRHFSAREPSWWRRSARLHEQLRRGADPLEAQGATYCGQCATRAVPADKPALVARCRIIKCRVVRQPRACAIKPHRAAGSRARPGRERALRHCREWQSSSTAMRGRSTRRARSADLRLEEPRIRWPEVLPTIVLERLRRGALRRTGTY